MRLHTLLLLAAVATGDSQLALAQVEATSEYKAGYARGHVVGLDFARETGSEPHFAYLSRMNGIMEQATPSNREAWRQGWVRGAQDGFRGIKPSRRNAGLYWPLSAAVARPNVKLYSYSEVHQATIVDVDSKHDRMTVKYRKSGDIEPKSISALSSLWFVKKSDPALSR